MHKSRSFPTFRGLNTVRWYLVLFPRYLLLDVWHRCHKNGSAGGLPRQSIGLQADFTEKVQPLRSDWSTYDPSGAECWSNAPLQGWARLKYTFARLLKPWRDFLILNETFCWLARPKMFKRDLLHKGQYQMFKILDYTAKTLHQINKIKTFQFNLSLDPRLARRNVCQSGKKSFWRGKMSFWRGKVLFLGETLHTGEERCTRSGNDAEDSAQLFHQQGSFVRRWVMRASRDGSMMVIVRHRVKDDFRLDLQWC